MIMCSNLIFALWVPLVSSFWWLLFFLTFFNFLSGCVETPSGPSASIVLLGVCFVTLLVSVYDGSLSAPCAPSLSTAVMTNIQITHIHV